MTLLFETKAGQRRAVCSICRRKFTATRSDAKLCSPACKQRSYRQRKGNAVTVTDDVTARESWATPQDLFDQLDAEFHFTLDAAANESNAKCARFYDRDADGLSQPWTETVWCNPPYCRRLGEWLRKGYESAQNGATVVMLVPGKIDTRWWHEWVLRGEVRFIPGRLRFGGSNRDAPFGSALVIFRPGSNPQICVDDGV